MCKCSSDAVFRNYMRDVINSYRSICHSVCGNETMPYQPSRGRNGGEIDAPRSLTVRATNRMSAISKNTTYCTAPMHLTTCCRCSCILVPVLSTGYWLVTGAIETLVCTDGVGGWGNRPRECKSLAKSPCSLDTIVHTLQNMHAHTVV